MLGVQSQEEEKLEISMVFKILTTSKTAAPKMSVNSSKQRNIQYRPILAILFPQGARAGQVGVGSKNRLLGKGLV